MRYFQGANLLINNIDYKSQKGSEESQRDYNYASNQQCGTKQLSSRAGDVKQPHSSSNSSFKAMTLTKKPNVMMSSSYRKNESDGNGASNSNLHGSLDDSPDLFLNDINILKNACMRKDNSNNEEVLS